MMRPRASNDGTSLIGIYLSTILISCYCIKQNYAIEKLPEKFSNDKLPLQNEQPTSVNCYAFLGCFNEIPIKTKAQDPLAIKTEFNISSSSDGGSVLVPFSHSTSCDTNHCELFPFDLDLLLKSGFNPDLRTVIITPGYLSKRHEPWPENVGKTWHQIEKANVIVVSWTGGNKSLYSWAVANTRIVARQITVLLYYLAQLHNTNLTDRNFSERIYLIGHSLGAHISAFVGSDFAGQVGRITGLDPAGPQFDEFDRSFKLDKSDAQLVDTLHTNGGQLSAKNFFYGIEEPIGHVDLYANDGKHQPNCQSDFFGCSHKLAKDIYLAFLENYLTMRNSSIDITNPKFHNHRVFAYRSESYEQFCDGKSLASLCPSIYTEGRDLVQADLNKCMLPVDYVSGVRELRVELGQYGIDFVSQEVSASRYFFHTDLVQPYVNNHYLLKIQLASLLGHDNTIPLKCDLMIHSAMSYGPGAEIELKNYDLIDEDEHKDILSPLLVRGDQNKIQLAKLEAKDFYIEDMERLQETLYELFPVSLRILSRASTPKVADEGRSLTHMLDDFFKLARDKTVEGRRCALDIGIVSVRPLKKLTRQLIARYTTTGKTKDLPTVIVSDDVNKHLQEVQRLRDKIVHLDEHLFTPGMHKSELYLDTVLIGPPEKDAR